LVSVSAELSSGFPPNRTQGGYFAFQCTSMQRLSNVICSQVSKEGRSGLSPCARGYSQARELISFHSVPTNVRFACAPSPKTFHPRGQPLLCAFLTRYHSAHSGVASESNEGSWPRLLHIEKRGCAAASFPYSQLQPSRTKRGRDIPPAL
jgi:hypothetical protein